VSLHQDLDVAFGLLNLLQLFNQVGNLHVASLFDLMKQLYTSYEQKYTIKAFHKT
jgi:hypothetical protein